MGRKGECNIVLRGLCCLSPRNCCLGAEEDTVGQLLAKQMQRLTVVLTPEFEKAMKKKETLVKELELRNWHRQKQMKKL